MGAALGELQHAADHVIIGRRPVPAALQWPAVDDVAHQVKRVAFDRFQEIDKQLGIAAARAEMDVGYPDRPESQPWPLMVIVFRLRLIEPGRQNGDGGVMTPAMSGAGARQCEIGGRRGCHLAPFATSSGCISSICPRSEEHTSELKSLMRRSYAVFFLKKKKQLHQQTK